MAEIIARSPIALGAHYTPRSTRFAIYVGKNATGVQLHLFDSPYHTAASRVIRFTESIDSPWGEGTGRIWVGHVDGLHVRQLYAFQVEGPWNPGAGDRYTPNLVLDPYAFAIGRGPTEHSALFNYKMSSGNDMHQTDEWNGHCCPLAGVIDHSRFDWQGDRRPNIPWSDTIIAELHVKAFTRLHPLVEREGSNGTYRGLSSDPIAAHFSKFGVTSAETMPIHAAHRVMNNRTRSWGYDPLTLFAPEPAYSDFHNLQRQVDEVKEMIRLLHLQGREVIIDFVPNHSAEGNHLGPTLSYRGIANGDYYRLSRDPNGGGEYRYYADVTGTGNTLNMCSPVALNMVLDAMRMWAVDYHVDGFRIDLALALLEGGSLFLEAVAADPVLSQLKLIAEPWHASATGINGFPHPWLEWNGPYRDDARLFVRGDPGCVERISDHVLGSRLRFPDSSRHYRTIKYVTCHDGRTMWDAVSFNGKYNHANGEGNADGDSNEVATNYGVEGHTDDPAINALRFRQCRNLFALLYLSEGPIMINGADTKLHTQWGNNNAYCHDSHITWVNWDIPIHPIEPFCEGLAKLRQRFPAIRKVKPRALRFNRHGHCMSGDEMREYHLRWFGLSYESAEVISDREQGMVQLFVLFNMHWDEHIEFQLPVELGDAAVVTRLLDCADEHGSFDNAVVHERRYGMRPRSIALLCARRGS